jgi:hypothetical protein
MFKYVTVTVAIYNVSWRYTMYHGDIRRIMAIYDVSWRYTMYHGDIQCIMAIYNVSWRYTMSDAVKPSEVV